MEHALSLWRVTHSSARIFRDNKKVLLLAGQGSYSSRSRHLAIRFMGLRNWIVDEKIGIVHVSIKDQLSVTYRLRSYFLDVPVKISAFLAFSRFPLSRPVSNFPIQVSIVGACWAFWNLCLISIVPCIELFNHLEWPIGS